MGLGARLWICGLDRANSHLDGIFHRPFHVMISRWEICRPRMPAMNFLMRSECRWEPFGNGITAPDSSNKIKTGESSSVARIRVSNALTSWSGYSSSFRRAPLNVVLRTSPVFPSRTRRSEKNIPEPRLKIPQRQITLPMIPNVRSSPGRKNAAPREHKTTGQKNRLNTDSRKTSTMQSIRK